MCVLLLDVMPFYNHMGFLLELLVSLEISSNPDLSINLLRSSSTEIGFPFSACHSASRTVSLAVLVFVQLPQWKMYQEWGIRRLNDEDKRRLPKGE